VADLVKENIKLSKTKYWIEYFADRWPMKKGSDSLIITLAKS